MRILVTGAKGMIGSHLVPYLEAAGHVVWGLDRRGTTPIAEMKDSHRDLLGDIMDRVELTNLVHKIEPDMVIHMAGEVGRLQGEENPQAVILTNCIGTTNIIDACIDAEIKLVNFSSSEIYGNLFDYSHPISEADAYFNSTPFRQKNVYAMSKLFAEGLVHHYWINEDLKAVTIRPFMIYGPGEVPSKYRSAMSWFVHRILTSQPFRVNRSAVRSWCHINDFLDGLNLVITKNDYDTYTTYNIGTSDYISMEALACRIYERVWGEQPVDLEYFDGDSIGVQVKRASFEKIKSLGFEPKINIDAGIESVIAWQREWLARKMVSEEESKLKTASQMSAWL